MRPPPLAFFSYVRREDQYENERLSRIRELLSGEVALQTGEQFEIFQDRNDIKWGQQWKARIKDSLDTATFLIPVLTPGFFNSPACREEVEIFLERERRLGRSDLILPLYYVEIPELKREELIGKDELLAIFAGRQFVDWRDLRFESHTSPQVGKMLANMALRIRDVLQETGGIAPAPRRPESKREAISVGSSQASAETKAPEPVRTEPPTIIVDALYRGQYVSIAEAVKNASPGMRILVRPGLYRESIVMDKPLEIIGDGNPGDVKLVGSKESALAFRANIGRVSNLTILQEGPAENYAVNITQGRLDLQDCDIASKSLGCVAIGANADPRLRNNRIHSEASGGVFIFEQASGTLEDNDIYGNALAGIEIRDSAAPTLRRNRIHGNVAGVYVWGGAQGLVEDNDIYTNDLSGVDIKRGASPTIRRNKIHDQKQNGVMVYDDGKGSLEDNDIYGNGWSGFQVRDGGDPVVRGNRTNKNGRWGIHVLNSGKGTFERNDLKGNVSGAWYIDKASLPLVKRSDNTQ